MKLTEKDKIRFMQKAYSLAKNGKSNSNIAALLVSENKIIGKGLSDSENSIYAEREAINSVKNKTKLKTASLFITLEPQVGNKTSEYGASFIAESKIKNVYIACKNKTPSVNGKAIEYLKKQNINVETSILEKECEYLYRSVFKYEKTGMPYVSVKYAMTLDGKIATVRGESKNILSQEAEEYMHKIRGEKDSVIVGSMTYIYDNPSLTVNYGVNKDKDILRMVITHKAALLPRTGTIFIDGGRALIIAVDKYKQTEKPDTIYAPSLKEMLAVLGKRGVKSILVEGGGDTISSFFTENLVDELFAFISPKLIGGKMAKTPFGGEGIQSMANAINLKNTTVEKIGSDILIHSVIKEY